MRILALILGILGGLCAIVGIVTALGIATALAVIPQVAALTWMFWFGLAGVLLIGCIGATVSRGSYK